MIPAARLAELAADTYSCKASWQVGDVAACLSRVDGIDVIAFRGTEIGSAADWMRDLSAWPQLDPDLGYCHRGFLQGALAIAGRIASDALARPLILTGHSLGGALALLYGAILTVGGHAPFGIVTFGAPRIGFKRVAEVLDPVDVTLYANGNDPVPGVPWWLPWWPYQHPRPLTPIGTARSIPLECHGIECYRAALAEAMVAA